MKNKQKLLWMAILGMIILLAVACAKSSSDDDAATVPETSETTAKLVFPPSPMQYIEAIE